MSIKHNFDILKRLIIKNVIFIINNEEYVIASMQSLTILDHHLGVYHLNTFASSASMKIVIHIYILACKLFLYKLGFFFFALPFTKKPL